MNQIDLNSLLKKIENLSVQFALNLLLAIAIFLIGRWIARAIRKFVDKVLTKAEVDKTLKVFLENLVYFLLMFFVIIAVVDRLGVPSASLVALLGAAGLAVGLALQGSLANFAAGVLLIVFRPFKVGDYVEGGGSAGTVEKISIFTTQLKTPDNKTVIIPNAKMTGDNIVNYSAKSIRRVDLVFGISYSDDIDKAKEIIRSVLAGEERIIAEPATTIAVLRLGDSSVDLAVRPWVSTADYWNVYFSLTESIKKRFDENNITIPFPQRDVHIYQNQ
jgi:small conductance mechanosensitive channel